MTISEIMACLPRNFMGVSENSEIVSSDRILFA